MSGKYKRVRVSHDVDDWLRAHASINGPELYRQFVKKWPQYSELKQNSFIAMRKSRGAYEPQYISHGHILPLYSERTVKGAQYVKIAQPKSYMLKQKWVWIETHPGELYKDTDTFIFLDGDRSNFAPGNIEKLSRAELVRFANAGGTHATTKEMRLLILAQVRLSISLLDAQVKTGTATKSKCGGYYVHGNPKARERCRRYYAAHKDDPEYKARALAANRKWLQNMSPARRAEWLEHRREYRREYRRRKRANDNNKGNL